MPRIVHCRKLDKDLPGIPFKPFDDELGQRVYDEISMEAWQKWLQESGRFVTTYRLDLADPKAQEFMRKQMAVYFGFETGDMAATAWVPPKAP